MPSVTITSSVSAPANGVLPLEGGLDHLIADGLRRQHHRGAGIRHCSPITLDASPVFLLFPRGTNFLFVRKMIASAIAVSTRTGPRPDRPGQPAWNAADD